MELQKRTPDAVPAASRGKIPQYSSRQIYSAEDRDAKESPSIVAKLLRFDDEGCWHLWLEGWSHPLIIRNTAHLISIRRLQGQIVRHNMKNLDDRLSAPEMSQTDWHRHLASAVRSLRKREMAHA